LKHGLRAQRFIYRDEDGWEFVELQMALLEQFRPEGVMEEYLVQRIAIAMWQVWRSLWLETDVVETARWAGPHVSRGPEHVAQVLRNMSAGPGSDAPGSDAPNKDAPRKDEQGPTRTPTIAALLEVASAQNMPIFPLLLRYRAAADGTLYKALNQLRSLQAERKSGGERAK
jgi:hypothetical protein